MVKKTRTSRPDQAREIAQLRLLSLAMVLTAGVGAATMAAKHIWGLSLPGCGPGGGCDWAIRGPFSQVAGLPVAFVGVAVLVAVGIILSISKTAASDHRFLWAVRLGAVVSIVYIGIMVTHGKICLWCSITHAGNLIFWALSERQAKLDRNGGRLAWRKAAYGIAGGIIAFSGAVFAQTLAKSANQEAQYRQGMASVEKIGQAAPVAGATSPSTQPQSGMASATRFGGRYWNGNPDAPVRIVMFHDYQCELCKDAEAHIAKLLKERPDVAFSVKQWPFDAECNRFILGSSMHPGACRAAKVAEAAGEVGGEAAFWSVHHWLVGQGGNFNDVQMVTKIDQLGLDRQKFFNAMNSSRVDSLIRADIEEGMAFGLTYTPLLFVNGYRVDGWQSVGVLPAAIERAAAVAKSQPRVDDRPDLAITQQYRDWLMSRVVPLLFREGELAHGPVDAKTTILVYGDLTCAFHASAYVMLEQSLRGKSDVRYVFRDFPLDSTCNDLLPKQINAGACQASRWAIAAGLIGGDSAYWSAHDYLVYHRGKPEDMTLAKVAEAASIDPAALAKAAATPRVQAILEANISLAKQMKVDTSPTIFINGRMVKGWRTPGLMNLIISNSVQTGK